MTNTPSPPQTQDPIVELGQPLLQDPYLSAPGSPAVVHLRGEGFDQTLLVYEPRKEPWR